MSEPKTDFDPISALSQVTDILDHALKCVELLTSHVERLYSFSAKQRIRLVRLERKVTALEALLPPSDTTT